MNTANKRVDWIDLARALAILFVVLCHSSEAIYSFDMKYVASLSLQSRIFEFTSFTIGRLGVPLFLMISGYLLLDRDYTDQKCKGFWKKNL